MQADRVAQIQPVEKGELMVQPKLTIPDTLGPLKLDASGRIIDYLNPQRSRANNPEELVRQYYARVLVEEYGYPKSWMVFEAPVSIGSETKSADIVIFQSASAAGRARNRARFS